MVRVTPAVRLLVNGEEVDADLEVASGDVVQLAPLAAYGVELHLGSSLEAAPARVAAPSVSAAAAVAPARDDGDTQAMPAEPEPEPGDADTQAIREEPAPESRPESRPGPATEPGDADTQSILEDPAPEPALPAEPAFEADPEIEAPFEPDHDATHVSQDRVETGATATLQASDIKAALDKARARHAADVARGDASLPSRSAPTPRPFAERESMQVRPEVGALDLHASRREAAVHIHVQVPGSTAQPTLLREGTHLLGRGPRCRVRLEHPSISIEHCEIHVGPQGVRVRAISPSGLILRDGHRHTDGVVEIGQKLQLGELQAWFEEL